MGAGSGGTGTESRGVGVCMHLYTQVHAGSGMCQEQGMWALHNLVGAQLAAGDTRVVAQLQACGAAEVLQGVSVREDVVGRLAAMLLGLIHAN